MWADDDGVWQWSDSHWNSADSHFESSAIPGTPQSGPCGFPMGRRGVLSRLRDDSCPARRGRKIVGGCALRSCASCAAPDPLDPSLDRSSPTGQTAPMEKRGCQPSLAAGSSLGLPLRAVVRLRSWSFRNLLGSKPRESIPGSALAAPRSAARPPDRRPPWRISAVSHPWRPGPASDSLSGRSSGCVHGRFATC
jgi:hypothetical protein